MRHMFVAVSELFRWERYNINTLLKRIISFLLPTKDGCQIAQWGEFCENRQSTSFRGMRWLRV